MALDADRVLGQNLGTDDFQIDWKEGESDLFWILDDNHCPNPLSPMYFDIGGWWLTCDHMFRRFGTPFASDWVAKNINGYLYTAAIPADSSVRAEAAEYQSRYAPRVPESDDYAAKIGAYLGGVLPYYAENFMEWWNDRILPDIKRNFEYIDGFDKENSSLVALAVLLEDMIDIHDRHWKIHWTLNFAQFSATTALNAAIDEFKPNANPDLKGRLQNSVEDRNWDSIEALWRIKELVKADNTLRDAFSASTPTEVIEALKGSEKGQALLSDYIEPFQEEFGHKAMWCHEVIFPLWRENPSPIIEAIRGYILTDYDYPAAINHVREDLNGAIAELLEGIEGEDRAKLESALNQSLKMNPLTPDHHFYIDQGTNARLRTVLIALGRKLVEADILDDAEDIAFLHYNELRALVGDAEAYDARDLVSDRRDAHEEATSKRPPDWVGTATEEALAFPYASLWGFPEKFYRKPPTKSGEVNGLAASPGVIEGTARLVLSADQFEDVQEGDILVCKMTNPAWVVLFTKISGLVTDAGGSASHSAVVSREFGLPAVVGTSYATQQIKSGDRVRVNGTTGVVEILS
ncbi:PEP-utilizing enzyme [Phaeobacter italicus]|jgi:pyruvate,water dikinase|uniref:PEP-utilizing enzyme n=1 Tax=Phaeobacter italicus TaxID=481446 RepID=UPI002FDAC9C8